MEAKLKSTFLAKKLGLPVLAVSTALMFTGCGSSDSTSTPAANNVAVNGVAVKGPFKRSSSVSVFGLKQDGTKTLLGSSSTLADDGSFSVSVPKQVGPVIVEVAGSYESEVGATDATGTIKSVAFVDGTTAIMPDLLVTPVSHIVANIIENNAGNATSTKINQTGQSVSAALGLTGLNVLTGQAPAIFSTSANSTTLSTATTVQKQLGAVISGFERLRGNTSYNSFFGTRLSTTTTGGLIPDQFKADLVTSIASQVASIASSQTIFQGQDSIFQNLISTSTWTSTGVDLSLHTVDLFADSKAHSFGQSFTTSMTAGQSISVMALIGASATANLTYAFTLYNGSSYVTPLSSMLTGLASTGALTGATSFTGVFSTTIPATYTLESEVRQNGRTEVAKAGVTIQVNAVATTPPPASTDTYSFTFGNFTSDMVSGKKFHTSYDGKAAAIDKDGALRQVISFLSDGNYVRVRHSFSENTGDLPITGQGTFAARGTWAVATESTFGVIRMTETVRFPVANSTISTTATAVTSQYRIVLDPAATASNLQLKFIRTEIYEDGEFKLDPANPFKDKIGGAFGSADIFTPSNICGGSTSLPTLPATTTLLTLAGQSAEATGCATVPAQ